MGALPIDFVWARDRKGYHLEDAKPPHPQRVVRNGSNDEQLETYRPLDRMDRLFIAFANTAISPNGVLEFVRKYGSLTWAGTDSTKGDPVNLVIMNAESMRQILGYSSGDRKRPPKRPPLDEGPTPLPITLHGSIILDVKTGLPKLLLSPNTLFDALWLQLAQELSGGRYLRRCEQCGAWFETGAGTGRRLDAKFCSDEHRITFNSLKRSREK